MGRTLPAMLLTVGLLAISGTSAATPLDSGIRIKATIGPVCPVEHPGDPSCTPRPYDARIGIRRAGSSRSRTVRTGADGAVRVRLVPGRYRLTPTSPTPGAMLPRASAVSIRVRAHRFTPVRIDFDSGIR